MAISSEVREVIRKVRDEILTGSEKWTQSQYARDIEGYSVPPYDNSACRWCLVGAALAVLTTPIESLCASAEASLSYRDVLSRLLLGELAYQWNDAPGRTFEDVRALLDLALAEEVQQ